jgi:hypothetical protein
MSKEESKMCTFKPSLNRRKSTEDGVRSRSPDQFYSQMLNYKQ